MTLLFTLLTLAVLGVIAAVATGRIAGGLEEPSTSLAPRGLPEGPVTAESLEVVRFSPALRGYRMEEVDAVLDRLGGELARRDRQILQLSQELRLAERAFVQRAARGSATPDWVSPVTGSVPVAGSAPVTGSVPVGSGHGGRGVNGTHEPDPSAQAYPAASYTEQGFGSPSYAAQGYAGQGYADQSYADQSYADQSYADQSYADQSYADQSYAGQGYAGQAYPPAAGYPGGSGYPADQDQQAVQDHPARHEYPTETARADDPDRREG